MGGWVRPPKQFVPDPYAYHTELELTVESLTTLGQGVCRDRGWVVMVPFVIPGERVRVRVFRNFSGYSEADLVEVLAPSEDRVRPGCPHFGSCGGCQLQHIGYARQLREKTARVAEIMERIGGITHPVEPAHGSPTVYGYRSKLTPHYGRPAEDGSQPIGFLKVGRRNQMVDVAHCPIATDAINAALPEARERARRESGRKRRRRGGTLLLRDALEGVVTDPKAVVSQRVGGLTFQFIAGEFFQNNPFLLPEMVAHVVEEAGGAGVRFLVDAYCGVGLFAVSAAARFEAVAGVEISEAAVRWARANARINGADNARFHTGKAEAVFAAPGFSGAETAVVVDPPRKGCDPAFLRQLAEYRPRRIVYVSCDPSTQARDLSALRAEGYGLRRLRPFDLFPHTRHIESVATLVDGGADTDSENAEEKG